MSILYVAIYVCIAVGMFSKFFGKGKSKSIMFLGCLMWPLFIAYILVDFLVTGNYIIFGFIWEKYLKDLNWSGKE